MGRGASNQNPGGIRESSLSADSPWARPVRRRRHPDPDLARFGATFDTYRYKANVFELESSPAPFDLETGRVFEDHDVYNEAGAWIGADRPAPHRRFTTAVLVTLSGAEIQEIFRRYAEGDYGEGEAGFAVYESREGERLYLVDDAARSPEGAEPLRDPATSPGPETLMLASDY